MTRGRKRKTIQEDSGKWSQTIHKAAEAIVSVSFAQVATFDTEVALVSEASGFIVDSALGLVLTNRHVACSGPWIGEIIFNNHEELDARVVYRDPIHDFGILQFDPTKLKFQALSQIPLAPEKACLGLEIRVVGNDAGEKLSIISGSISRNAPEYGELNYNDFNSVYLQAAGGNSGGSSGSPVLDIDGCAVALQAGGHTRASTDFFYPLERVKRAVEYIRKGQPVPRGTIQTQFLHKPFDQIRRLGFPQQCESKFRDMFPDEIGLLVAETVLPDGPAMHSLEQGDVLVSVNGKHLTKFLPLEEILDSMVGQMVEIVCYRGSLELKSSVMVQDLHSITPDCFVSFGGATFHTISYQLARQYALPVSGVFLLENAGIWRLESGPSWLIKTVDSKPVPTLDAFIKVIRECADGAMVPVTYCSISDAHSVLVKVVTIEMTWNTFTLSTRNDKTGLWDKTSLLPHVIPKHVHRPLTASFPTLDDSLGPCRKLQRSFVQINGYFPLKIDGTPHGKRLGNGLVIDSKRGYILSDRMNVPIEMGIFHITVADSVQIPARVVFLHPTLNIAILAYDPNLLGDTAVDTPIFDFENEIKQGNQVILAGISMFQRPLVREILTVPDAIALDTPLSKDCQFGVLTSPDCRIRGLWLPFLSDRNSKNNADVEFHLGLQIRAVQHCLLNLDKITSLGKSRLYGFAAEVNTLKLSYGRQMGITADWISKLERAKPWRPQAYMVTRTESGSPTETVLQDMDIILSLDGKPFSNASQLEPRVDYNPSQTREMTVLRHKQEITLQVPLSPMNESTRDAFVSFVGAIVQEPHRAVLQQFRHKLPSRVYVTNYAKGSPAEMYGLFNTFFITKVDGVDIHSMEDFVQAAARVVDNEYIRIKCMTFDMIPTIVSVKSCFHYFPTIKHVRDEFGQWKRERVG